MKLKQNKISIDSIIRNTILFSTMLLLLCLILITSFIYYAYNLENKSKTLRGSLQTINSMISDLYDYERAEANKTVHLETFFSKKEKLEKTLEKCNHSLPVLPIQKENIGDISAAKVKQTISMLGDSAREISNGYHQLDDNLSLMAILFFVFLISALFIILIILIFIRRYSIQFYAHYRNILEKLRSLINYDTEPKFQEDTRWLEEKNILETAKDIYKQIHYDRKLNEIQEYGTLETFMPRLMNIIEQEMPVHRIAVAFLDPLNNVIAESAASKLDRLELSPGYIEHINDTTLEALIKTGKPRIINNLKEHYDTVNSSKSTRKILDEGINSSLTLPIFIQSKCIGFCFISHSDKYVYEDRHIKESHKILNVLKQNLYSQYLIQQIISQSANSFVQLMQKKDNETSFHILRMSRYSYAIGRQLLPLLSEVTPRFLREILWFAPLHDIGKIGIPDSILLKPDKLDAEEWTVMKTHVEIGLNILQDMNNGINDVLQAPMLDTAIDILKGHHEKYDGSGYPYGLEGKDIPLAGRIAAAADVFDALTSKRPYKEAFSFEKSISILIENSGSHFDPDIIEALENALPEIQEIYEKYKEI